MNKKNYLNALLELLTDKQILKLNIKYKLTAKAKGSELNEIIAEIERILQQNTTVLENIKDC